MKLTAKKEKHLFWQKHIEKWQESGVSQAKYCEVNQLKLRSFVYYRHKISNSSKQPPKAVKFVSISTSKSNLQPHSKLGIQLILPNGIRIGISSEVKETFLQMVLQTAGKVTC